jgi:glycine/D-amino acid oxidase-like deaminating enzyme
VRVVVVGGGIMGLCSAWALVRTGHEVALYEQGPLPNPLGSSVDDHRIIRFAYGAMTGYARMVEAAYGAWERVFADLGERLYREVGILVVARDEGGWVGRSLAEIAALGQDAERLEPDGIRRLLPFLDLEGVRLALHARRSGVLLASRIVDGLARHLAAQGVAVHAETRVVEIVPAGAAVRLADGRHDSGDALVVAAGPWAPRLLPGLAGRVTPSRQVVVYLQPPAAHLEAWRTGPVLGDQIEAASGGFYAVPPVDGFPLKIGDHSFSLRGDPDREREATAGDIKAVLALARARIEGFDDYRVVGARTCFYDVAPEERFIVLPLERAWVLAGFSGHGFKFGPVIGEAVAAAIEGRREARELTAWAAGHA